MKITPNVGELWIAHRDEEPDTRWLFRIVATTIDNRKTYWLGAKVDWDTRKIMPSDVHTHWFDSTGNETNDCSFDHGYFLTTKESA